MLGAPIQMEPGAKGEDGGNVAGAASPRPGSPAHLTPKTRRAGYLLYKLGELLEEKVKDLRIVSSVQLQSIVVRLRSYIFFMLSCSVLVQ